MCKRKSASIIVAGVVFITAEARAQVEMSPEHVNSGRPVAEAILKLQERCAIPINYEDVRYEYEEDIKDITDEVTTAEQRTMAEKNGRGDHRILIPRGGQISALVPIDRSLGVIPDKGSVLASLRSFVSAYEARELPGGFVIDEDQDAIFVEPEEMRDAHGAVREVGSILSTPIYLEEEQRTAFETLDMILDQVEETVGYRVGMGSVPMNLFIMGQVEIGSDGQTARVAILDVFRQLSTDSVKLAYRLLYDPGLRWYMFNVRPVPDPLADRSSEEPPSEIELPISDGEGAYWRKMSDTAEQP